MMAALDELIGDHAPDVAGSAGDEYSHGLLVPRAGLSKRSASRCATEVRPVAASYASGVGTRYRVRIEMLRLGMHLECKRNVQPDGGRRREADTSPWYCPWLRRCRGREREREETEEMRPAVPESALGAHSEGTYFVSPRA